MQQWSFETSTSLTATQCRRKPQNPGCSCMLNLSLLWLSAFCSVSCWPGRAGPGVSLLVAALASRLVRIRVRATSVVSFERWAVGGWSHRGVGAHVSMAKAGAIWQGGARALAQAGSGAGEETPLCSDEAWSPSTMQTRAQTPAPLCLVAVFVRCSARASMLAS